MPTYSMKLNPLTSEEKRVIEDRGTEAPFSGEYERVFESGVYLCRRCNAPLYRSEDKFDARCGWPSFDDAIPGAVTNIPDDDGMRTEIRCARCDAHLGHVFSGEQLTPKNMRYCVNSLSMRFMLSRSMNEKKECAYFGGGCFWCTEAAFQLFRGVLSVTPGYAGGVAENPTYESVSGGTTGHAEVVRVEYDPFLISYEFLLQVFFSAHDPTSRNRQGADIGTQYRSIILYMDDIQKEIAEKTIFQFDRVHIFPKPILTEVRKFETFFPAEEYHVSYFEKNESAPYCQVVINPKLQKLRKQFERYVLKA